MSNVRFTAVSFSARALLALRMTNNTIVDMPVSISNGHHRIPIHAGVTPGTIGMFIHRGLDMNKFLPNDSRHMIVAATVFSVAVSRHWRSNDTMKRMETIL
mmetsp:Transcript_7108/g.13891  ORF Transcript_7108/g.13891 Transcript_7108/m.13891 type:complete len:101 (-) Transcript_7108:381-683(-)